MGGITFKIYSSMVLLRTCSKQYACVDVCALIHTARAPSRLSSLVKDILQSYVSIE